MLVEDVNATVAFYRDILGFRLVRAAPEGGPFDWALVRRGRTEVMFQTRACITEALPILPTAAPGGALTFYIDTENVAGLYEQLRPRVEVVAALHGTFYGTQEFSIRDPNGFILTFAEHQARREAA